MSYPPGTIIRYSTASRINHWITAIFFTLLVLSGLSMFHPMLFWLSSLFGGGQWTRAAHPWFGCVLFVSYMGMIVQFWRDELPSRDDVAWIGAIDLVLVNKEEGVPEVGLLVVEEVVLLDHAEDAALDQQIHPFVEEEVGDLEVGQLAM